MTNSLALLQLAVSLNKQQPEASDIKCIDIHTNRSAERHQALHLQHNSLFNRLKLAFMFSLQKRSHIPHVPCPKLGSVSPKSLNN